jgi:hypothetical protein
LKTTNDRYPVGQESCSWLGDNATQEYLPSSAGSYFRDVNCVTSQIDWAILVNRHILRSCAVLDNVFIWFGGKFRHLPINYFIRKWWSATVPEISDVISGPS